MVELLKPIRGGFLRPFGCAWFIREFLLGNGPNGSPIIDPEIGAPQADIFHHYKIAIIRATALDRATREEEKRARREKRAVSPDNIEKLAQKYQARMPYKAQGCRYHSFVVYFSNLQRLGWVEFSGKEEVSAIPRSSAGFRARTARAPNHAISWPNTVAYLYRKSLLLPGIYQAYKMGNPTSGLSVDTHANFSRNLLAVYCLISPITSLTAYFGGIAISI